MSIRKNLLLLGGALLLSGCLSTIDSTHLQVPKPVADDPNYAKVYRDSTASFDVIHHFETKYKIHITQLNSNFRLAMAKRHQDIFHEPQPVLTEASSQTGFFITLYAQNNALLDLADERLWTVQLKIGERLLKPSVIKSIKPKERWAVFFPEINLWSRDYLVLFDQTPPSKEPDSINYSSELILASPQGSVSSRW